jgi:hypothetical protein
VAGRCWEALQLGFLRRVSLTVLTHSLVTLTPSVENDGFENRLPRSLLTVLCYKTELDHLIQNVMVGFRNIDPHKSPCDHIGSYCQDVLSSLQWFFPLLQRARRATRANIGHIYQHHHYIWRLRSARFPPIRSLDSLSLQSFASRIRFVIMNEM